MTSLRRAPFPPKETRENENMPERVARQQADIDYLAIMTGVDLEEGEEEENGTL